MLRRELQSRLLPFSNDQGRLRVSHMVIFLFITKPAENLPPTIFSELERKDIISRMRETIENIVI